MRERKQNPLVNEKRIKRVLFSFCLCTMNTHFNNENEGKEVMSREGIL